MNRCKYTKELIDKTEKPDLLPLDVEAHIAECSGCNSFANERAALRKLLGSNTRVSAPPNFDAVLKARLAEVKARRSFWWLGTPTYLRFGAAAASLIVMFFAAQYAGLFTSSPTSQQPTKELAERPSQPPVVRPAPAVPSPTQQLPEVTPPRYPAGSGQRTKHSVPIYEPATAAAYANPSTGYLSPEDGVVLVRGRNGDVDVQMPTVSVGAQPLLYVSAGQHRPVRSVGTSF
jgi:hypothetical protein